MKKRKKEKEKHAGGAPKQLNALEEAKALLEWAEKEESYALVGFCAQRDLWPQRICELAKECEEFAASLRIAKFKIAERLHVGVHKGKLNQALALRQLGQYDRYTHEYDKSLLDDELDRKKKLIDHEIKVKSALPQLSPEQVDNMRILNEQLIALQSAQKKS